MLVKQGDRICLEARAKAEPAADVMTHDYYTVLPHLCLTGDPDMSLPHPGPPTEVRLDDTDVTRLVECAIRHPTPNMRYAVLAAIWNHPDSFRQIFRFGLTAPPGSAQIRKIVAEELDKSGTTREPAAPDPGKPALLPRMPLPAHLRDRERPENE